MENENQIPNGKKAMKEELIRGRDMVNQLLEVLGHDKLNTHLEKEEGSKSVLPFVEDLVRKVLCSFTNTLLLLNSNNHVSHEVVASTTPKDVSSSTSSPKLEFMDEICKSLNTKSRRRGYKRKSIAPTWEKDSSILIEDGYVWRKYGQKMTLNSKYLRSYYRCTHKNDQGCQAMKQVQRIQDNPPSYRTIYYGHHTCRNPLNPEIILEPLSPCASSTLLCFNNSFQSKQENPFPSSLLASTNHEPVEVIQDYPEIILEPLSPCASSTLLCFNNSFQSKQENPFPSSLLASTNHEPVEVIQDYHSAQHQLSSPEDLLLYDYDFSNYSNRVAMLSSTETVEFENIYEQFGF